VLLFVVSALVSGSEVAYFSRKSPSDLARVKAFGLLATILVLNNLANSYLSSIVADVIPASDVVVAIALSLAITVFAEFIPKRIALSHPWIFVRFTEGVYRPLATLFSLFKLHVEADSTRLSTPTVMEAVVDAVRNSELTPDERLYIGKMLYAIHGKGYVLLYPLSESPLLRFEMSVKEALRILEEENYDRDWVPVYYISPEENIHMVSVKKLRESDPNAALIDVGLEKPIYYPLLGSFVKLLKIVEEKGYVVLVDEYGNVRGFAYRKDVEIWLLSAGDVLPVRTSLLEIYIMVGRELGPLHWDIADLFQYYRNRLVAKGKLDPTDTLRSIVVKGVKLTMINDMYVKVEVLKKGWCCLPYYPSTEGEAGLAENERES